MKPICGSHCTAFQGEHLIASGKMVDVGLDAKAAYDKNPASEILVFDDETGRTIEFDFRGSEEKFLQRLKIMAGPIASEAESKPAGPGRPKLGVVSREIGLLPRHWEWLGRQPGGASSTLRRLVEDAQKKNASLDEFRRAQEATHQFMTAMAGNFPDYEEALRAFYAKDRTRFSKHMAAWPKDVREHALKLAKSAL